MLNFLRNIKHGSKHLASKYLIRRAERRVYKATSGTVIDGPFTGLILVNRNVFGSEIPKLLGSYEKELFSSLGEALQRKPKTVGNIGAAEGYYALGCARYPSVEHVFVFEALESGRKLIGDNLSANRIETMDTKFTINGLCDEQTLWATLNSVTVDLLLIDIEGAELDILSERNVEQLRQTELIIESHDFCRPGCIAELQQRFNATHELTIINSEKRNIEDFPSQISVPVKMQLELMDEKRPGIMQWLICQPKASS